MEYEQCKEIVNTLITEYLCNAKYDQRILEGMKYVLSGGKRLRSVLALAILEKKIPSYWKNYQQLCLVSEFIHCASLIIDDLPAFDNATMRRDQKCVHLVQGEGLAYLLSFNLVTESVLLVHNHLPILKEHHTTEKAYLLYEEQIKNVLTNISGKRALGGQLLSTFHTSGNINLRDIKTNVVNKLSREEICDILYKKTASFFEIPLILSWIIGNGDLDRLEDVKELSNLLGLCYQIYDDFVDYEEDVCLSGHFSHNYVYHRGTKNAYRDFLSYYKKMEDKITLLGLDCPVFDYVKKFMYENISSRGNI